MQTELEIKVATLQSQLQYANQRADAAVAALAQYRNAAPRAPERMVVNVKAVGVDELKAVTAAHEKAQAQIAALTDEVKSLQATLASERIAAKNASEKAKARIEELERAEHERKTPKGRR